MLNALRQNLCASLFSPATTGVAIALAIGGVAAAITSTDFTYSPPRQGYLSIHPMDMAPDSSLTANNYINAYDLAELKGSGCFNTGVNLPQGARISSIAIWFASGATSPFYQFNRNTLSNGANTTLISKFLESDTGTRTLHFSVIPQSANTLVDNAQAAYGLGVCLGSSDTFRGARIGYSYHSAGD